MIGELGGNVFLLQTFSEEQRQEMCGIIHYWALDHGYERMPDEYTTPDNFEGPEHASDRTVLYAKDNPKNGERYIISYTEARRGLCMQFALYVGEKTLMNETFTDTSVPITDIETLAEHMELKKTLLEATGGLEAIRENVRRERRKCKAFIILWILIVIGIIIVLINV